MVVFRNVPVLNDKLRSLGQFWVLFLKYFVKNVFVKLNQSEEVLWAGSSQVNCTWTWPASLRAGNCDLWPQQISFSIMFWNQKKLQRNRNSLALFKQLHYSETNKTEFIWKVKTRGWISFRRFLLKSHSFVFRTNFLFQWQIVIRAVLQFQMSPSCRETGRLIGGCLLLL